MIGITIIIPVYNSYTTIDKCIQSIIDQTFQDWEIVIIDDGSTDDTPEKLKYWNCKSPKIKVIDQENQGSGPARNAGIKNAEGKYIMFIDPDDWIESAMLQTYWDNAERWDVDLLISNSVSDHYENGKYLYSEYEDINELYCGNIHETRKIYLDLFVKGFVRGPVCKLYRKSIIDKDHIEFPDLRRSQDIVFNYRYYDKINDLYLFDSSLYHYVKEKSSQSNKIRTDYYKALSMIYLEIECMLKDWKIYPDKKTYGIFCNYLYDALLFQLQIGDSVDVMKDIVTDHGIRRLVRAAKPLSYKRRILRYFILLKQIKILNLSMREYKTKNEIKKKYKY